MENTSAIRLRAAVAPIKASAVASFPPDSSGAAARFEPRPYSSARGSAARRPCRRPSSSRSGSRAPVRSCSTPSPRCASPVGNPWPSAASREDRPPRQASGNLRPERLMAAVRMRLSGVRPQPPAPRTPMPARAAPAPESFQARGPPPRRWRCRWRRIGECDRADAPTNQHGYRNSHGQLPGLPRRRVMPRHIEITILEPGAASLFACALPGAPIGIGGAVTCAPLPHHRTCGSASGGSAG